MSQDYGYSIGAPASGSSTTGVAQSNVTVAASGITPLKLAALSTVPAGNAVTVTLPQGFPGELAYAPSYAKLALTPGKTWTGTKGSGYGGAPPVDPTRTTAKPSLRMMTVWNQRFTSDLDIGVLGFAKGGIKAVTFYCEGNTVVVTAPTLHAYVDANGRLKSELGYFCTLDFANFPTNGQVNIYAKATPNDSTMQERVIGPYNFDRQTQLHDFSLTVAAGATTVAGSTYPTIPAALNYLSSQAAKNPLITITKTGNYDIANPGGACYPSPNGFCTITTAAGVTATIVGAKPAGAPTAVRPMYDDLHFMGAGIVIDMSNWTLISYETSGGGGHWFDGCEIWQSIGRYGLSVKTERSSLSASWVRSDVSAQPNDTYRQFMTDCYIHEIGYPFAGFHICKNNRAEHTTFDMYEARLCFGNTCNDQSCSTFRQPIPAIKITYTGYGKPVVSKTGTNNRKGTIVLADGTNTYTFNVSDVYGTAGYNVQELADYINKTASAGGWAAVLLDDTRRLACLSNNFAGTAGAAFTNIAVPAAGLTLETAFDVHSDHWQTYVSPGWIENYVIFGNRNTNGLAQIMFVTGSTGHKDWHYVCNCDDTPGAVQAYYKSQFYEPHQHTLVWHNSIPNQEVVLRTDRTSGPLVMDAYCEFYGNIFYTNAWYGTPGPNGMTLGPNVIMTGARPSGDTTSVLGGTLPTIWANASASQLPASDLFSLQKSGAAASNTAPPRFPFDALHMQRGAASSFGAREIPFAGGTLSLAQANGLVIGANTTAQGPIGPLQLRWHQSAGESGPLVGVDVMTSFA
jgi:hypothetical protein